MKKLFIVLLVFVAIPGFCYDIDVTTWDPEWPMDKKEIVVHALYSGAMAVVQAGIDRDQLDNDDIEFFSEYMPRRTPEFINSVIRHFDSALGENEDPYIAFLDAIWVYKQDKRLGNI